MIEIAAAGFIESLLGLDRIAEDFNLLLLALKIVMLLFVVEIVKGRFGGGTLLNIIVLAFGYLVFFSPWAGIFNVAMIVYMVIAFGLIHFLLDVTFTKSSWAEKPEGGSGGHREGGAY